MPPRLYRIFIYPHTLEPTFTGATKYKYFPSSEVKEKGSFSFLYFKITLRGIKLFM